MDNDNFNKLTAAQTERLALLAEECGEVIHVIGKILRHGYESTNPDNGTGETNRAMLEEEIGEVQQAVTMMATNGDIDSLEVNRAQARKANRVGRYLHHQATSNL